MKNSNLYLIPTPIGNYDDITIVCPDESSIDRNQYFANRLDCPLMIFNKKRDYRKISVDCDKSNIEDFTLVSNMNVKSIAIIIAA